MKHPRIIAIVCVMLFALLPFACTTKFEESDTDEEDPGEISPDSTDDRTERADDAGPDTVDAPDMEAESHCGNSVQEPGEECDDGNPENGDGCENDCTWTCEIEDDCPDVDFCTERTCNASHECEPGAPIPFLHHVIQISAGYLHTCALIQGGGVKCWGNNQFGQVGDGTTTNRSAPVDVVDLASGVESLAAGGLHTCAVMSGGAGMKCWGFGGDGQLGNATLDNSDVPVDVTGLPTMPIKAAAAGGFHTCILLETTGGVKCWGMNSSGQLGNGITTGSNIPVDVSGLATGVADIAAGRKHTCAVLNTGRVKCWGSNFTGQLGDGSIATSTTPVDVHDISDADKITAGGIRSDADDISPKGHTCSLSRSGGVMCWGNNSNGQLGDNTTDQSLVPVQVIGMTSGVTQISAGSLHTCAINGAEELMCWGANPWGQLGDGTTDEHPSPVPAADSALAVSLGQFHTCALITLDEGVGVICWGNNDYGQLGDGSTDGRRSPTNVLCR